MSRNTLRFATALATLAIPLTAATGAHAATVTFDGGVLTVTGTTAAEYFYETTDFSAEPKLRMNVDVGGMNSVGPCTVDSGNANQIRCTSTAVTKIIYNMGAGDDKHVTGMSAAAGGQLQMLELNGGPGRDDLRGGPLGDLINGDSGNDTQLYGDAGNDTVNGGEGDDPILSGSGANEETVPGADIVSGGPGVDTLLEERNFGRKQFWSLDGVANDGVDLDDNVANGSEEGDNIMADVENITSGFDDDTLVGNAANNVFRAGTLGNDTVLGLEGDDDIFSGVSGELDVADGGPGNDKVQGNHDLKGGPGNDQIFGQGSNDQIDGGPGLDTISGSDGNDVIQAVDGEVDQVNCGVGADIANADAADVVSTQDSGSICETLTRATPPAGGGGPNQTGNPNAGLTGFLFGGGKLTATGATLNATVPAPGTISISVVVPTATISAKKKTVTVGSGKATATKAGKVKVKIKWKKGKAAKRLRGKKKLKATLKISFRAAGSDDAPVKSSRSFTFKR